MTNTNFQKLAYIASFSIIFLLGIFLRLTEIGRYLEYDEIWTFTHYSSNSISLIFTDLATPNNHPINSLLIKYSLLLFGNSVISLRLVALISGILVICTAPVIAYMLFKNKYTTILSMLLCSFSGGLTYYSQTARGYELQTLLVLITALVIILSEKKIINNILSSFLLIITSILSVLTLPTSILFLFPIFTSHLLYLLLKSKRLRVGLLIRQNIYILLGYIVIAVFCFLWFFYNYHKFKSGQNFGNEVSSIASFSSFTLATLMMLSPFPLVIISFFSWIKSNKLSFIAYIFLLIFPFLSAVMTKEGPVRVYLPLIPFILIFASQGISTILSRITQKTILRGLQIIILIAVSLFMYHSMTSNKFKWINPDWTGAAMTAYSNMPQDTYVSMPATSGYAVMFNSPIIFKYEEERTPKAGKSILVNLVEGTPSSETKDSYSTRFNGISPKSMNTENINFNFSVKPKIIDISSLYGCFAEIYELKSMSNSIDIPKNIFISLFPDRSKPRIILDPSFKTILINLWLRPRKLDSDYLTFIANNSSLPEKYFKELEEMSQGQLKFYSIYPLEQ